ncbi:MAG: hypothetical protein ACODAD_12025, partial [Planctomycetota bacterium]
MSTNRQEQFRKIPSVEAVLADPRVQHFAAQLSRGILRNAARNATDQVRAGLQAGVISEADHASLQRMVIDGAVRELRAAIQPQYQKVINASGIILHTGLGRAVLPPAALKHILDDLSGYSLLQMDLDTGRR